MISRAVRSRVKEFTQCSVYVPRLRATAEVVSDSQMPINGAKGRAVEVLQCNERHEGNDGESIEE